MSVLAPAAWPAPAPLTGVKSRKRVLFEVTEAAELRVGDEVSRVCGVRVTLETRLVAAGAAGQALTDLLLGRRGLVAGVAKRHEGLSVAHLGPHLAEVAGGGAAGCAAAAAAVLEEARPQVVVLEQGCGEAPPGWAEFFAEVLASAALRDFRGAVVVCVPEETPEVAAPCQHRLGAVARWVWMEDLTGDSLEFIEDALAADANVPEEVLDEVGTLSGDCFGEADIVEICRKFDWTLTVVVERTADGMPDLRGYMCTMFDDVAGMFRIRRVAVPEKQRSRGVGGRLVRRALVKAALMPHSKCRWIGLMSLGDRVSYYEQFGFWDMTCEEEGEQKWMEMKNYSAVPAEA